MRRIHLLTLLAALIPALTGCFPVVATGVGTGAIMHEDRRTAGTFIEDEEIELKAGSRIGDALKDDVHINVTSINRSVLLTGEARTDAAKREAEQIARSITNVRNVTNDIKVSGLASFTSRSNDTYITSRVKMEMVRASKFSVNHVKVVTEDGVVYLMGMVTRKEAEDATEIARAVGGVQKVVKVFEYVD